MTSPRLKAGWRLHCCTADVNEGRSVMHDARSRQKLEAALGARDGVATAAALVDAPLGFFMEDHGAPGTGVTISVCGALVELGSPTAGGAARTVVPAESNSASKVSVIGKQSF